MTSRVELMEEYHVISFVVHLSPSSQTHHSTAIHVLILSKATDFKLALLLSWFSKTVVRNTSGFKKKKNILKNIEFTLFVLGRICKHIFVAYFYLFHYLTQLPFCCRCDFNTNIFVIHEKHYDEYSPSRSEREREEGRGSKLESREGMLKEEN